MASRVNVRFVVILSVVLVAAFGAVAFTAYKLFYNTATDFVTMGDREMAKKNFVQASIHYSKAVDREKTNVAYLQKWRDSLTSQTPERQVEYNDTLQTWVQVTRQMAKVQKDNIPVQREYLETQKTSILGGPYQRDSVAYLVKEADLALVNFDVKTPGPWEALRRYRGIAKLHELANTPDSADADWIAARADLEAALRADPADAEAALALEGLILELAGRAERDARAQDAARLTTEGNAVLTDFLAKNPEHPQALLAGVRRRFTEAVRTFRAEDKARQDAGQPRPDAVEEGKKFTASVQPILDAAYEAAKRNPATIDMALVTQLGQLESSLDPEAKQRRSADLIRIGLEKNPSDMNLLARRAELAAEQDDFDGAINHIGAILDLPTPPVSLEGAKLYAYKGQTRFLQAMWASRAAIKLPGNDPARAAAVARAREFRKALGEAEDPSSPRLQMVDAWLAALESDPQRADQILSALDKRNRIADPDTLILWAEVARQLNQPGATRERLARVMQVQPNNLNAALGLAQLYIGLQDFEAADNILADIQRAMPSNAAVAEQRRVIDSLRSGNTQQITDPGTRALVDAQNILEAGKGSGEALARAVEVLEKALPAAKDDPRVVRQLVSYLLRQGERAKALTIVQGQLAARPDEATLKQLEAMLTSEDTLEARIARINAIPDAKEVDKAIARFTAFRAAEMPAEAKAEVERLTQLAPDDARVVEIRFLDALERKDFKLANELVDKAAAVNADKVQGRTFKARLLATQDDAKAAEALMKEVTSAGGATPEAWRLQGRFQVALGRLTDAVTSYQEAIKLRPTDIQAIKDIVTTYVQLGQNQQALIEARKGMDFALNDEEFTDLWLKMESEFGNAGVALERREQLLRARPDDRENAYELARMYIRAGQLAKARPLIDKARELRDAPDSVALDATWHWVQNSRDAAKSVYTAFIEKAPDRAAKLTAALDYARFLLDRNDDQGAIDALEAAKAHQDPAQREADKAMAETLFARERYEEAAAALQALIAADADTADSGFRKRLVESLLRMDKPDEASAALAPLVTGKEPDLVTVLLEADVRGAQKKAAEQRQILDRAVAKYPAEAAVFLKRGQMMMVKEDTLRDSIADFTKAIQLQPQMWQAYRLRAAAYGQLKQPDNALSDLRQALRLNPADTALLVGLITDLVKLNRDQEAEQIANDTLKGRARDSRGLADVGNLFSQSGRPVIASRFYAQAFELDQTDAIAQRYLDTLLHRDVANFPEAEGVIRKLGERTAKNPGFTMALGKLRLGQNRPAEAAQHAVAAIRLIDHANPVLMLSWHNDMRLMLPDNAKYREFLDATIRAGVVPTANEWLAYFRCIVSFDAPDLVEKSVVTMRDLAANARSPHLRLLCYRGLGAFLYSQNKHDEAAAAWSLGLAAFPEDAEMANNLSFILATKLNRASEALPIAEKAAAAAPDNADVLDTLGVVQLRTDKAAEAVVTLGRALARVSQPRSAILICAHIAEAYIKTGKPDEARRAVEMADQVMKQYEAAAVPGQPAMDQETKDELENARKMLPPR